MLKLGWPVILASASPRRRELLSTLISEFEAVAPDIDETPLDREPPVETAVRLACEKAQGIARERPNAFVIGGDTVVVVPGDPELQLGKPADSEEARRMLEILSGRMHLVVTAIALVWPGNQQLVYDQTDVWFRVLSSTDIDNYVATGEPMDKAGAYAIQGGAAGFVERIEGSLNNVIGLPTEVLDVVLKRIAQGRLDDSSTQ